VFTWRLRVACRRSHAAMTCSRKARIRTPSSPSWGPVCCRGRLSGLTLRLIEPTERLTDLSGSAVEARFARLFLKPGEQFGLERPSGRFVPLPLSRQARADMRGTAIETCIRIMSRRGRDDVLATERDGLLLMNRRILEELSVQ
jgi:hypothetical protein